MVTSHEEFEEQLWQLKREIDALREDLDKYHRAVLRSMLTLAGGLPTGPVDPAPRSLDE